MLINPLDPSTLAEARKHVELSRSQLADMSGVDETTILRIEAGKVDPKLKSTWAPIVAAVQSRSKPKRRPAKPSAEQVRAAG